MQKLVKITSHYLEQIQKFKYLKKYLSFRDFETLQKLMLKIYWKGRNRNKLFFFWKIIIFEMKINSERHRTYSILYIFFMYTYMPSMSYLQHAKSTRWSKLITLLNFSNKITNCSISLITDLLCTCKQKCGKYLCYTFFLLSFCQFVCKHPQQIYYLKPRNLKAEKMKAWKVENQKRLNKKYVCCTQNSHKKYFIRLKRHFWEHFFRVKKTHKSK